MGEVVRAPSGTRFAFWRGFLLAFSALFAAQGVIWAVTGSPDPAGLYEARMAQALWGADRLPTDAERAFQFVLVPFGATTAGYFVLVFLVVWHAFPRRERWAYRAVVTAVLTWFALDTGLSAYHRAWFNVLLINVPCVLILGLPLLALRRHFAPDVSGAVPFSTHTT